MKRPSKEDIKKAADAAGVTEQEIMSGIQSTVRGIPEETLKDAIVSLPNIALSLVVVNDRYTFVEIGYDLDTGQAVITNKIDFGRDKMLAKETFKLKSVRTQAF